LRNLFVVFLFSFFALTSSAQEGRNVAEYNLNSVGTGFINGSSSNAKGFDPVSVFPEGGGVALEGNVEFSLDHEGVEYLFANQANLQTFLTNPKRYEPTYGGYCARAMVVGQKVHINTSLHTVVGNRSFFFVNKRAKRFFDRNVEKNAKKADQEWKRISGEEARL
jgi:YHS domain-containing protein